MPPLDRFPNDPFFKRGPSIEWNACIGTQGDEHSYVIGYMQAAMELVSAVIDKNQPGKRDTLVLPILYNARHAIELALKFCARRLVRAGLVQGQVKAEHKVKPLWQMLTDAKIGDRTLVKNIEALKPYIDSITTIDQDGQELRYHRNTDDDPSLSNYSIASLEVIRDSLVPLAEIVDILLFRTIEFLRDRATGTYTARCSRFDLFEITDMLPPLEQWNDLIFDAARDQIRAEFELSSNGFSKVINVIKAHRELRARLGDETPFQYLTDDLVVDAIKEWRKWHPKRERSNPLGMRGRDFTVEMFMGANREEATVVAAITKLLTPEQFGELAAIFFLARDRYYSEDFLECIEKEKNSFVAHDDPAVQIVYLFEKTNLLAELAIGVAQIGRLKLAETLSTL